MTTGATHGFTVANTAARPADYDHLKDTFRPSHADFTYEAKYGLRDVRGGGRASARETVSRVVAGAVARQILATLGVEVGAYVERVQDISMPLPSSFHSREEVDAHPVRCPHPETAARMADRIADVKKAGDTVGGAIVLVARGVPAGWGEPVFDRLHADLAKAMWSLPATKSLELGSGLSGTLMRGSEHNDAFVDQRRPNRHRHQPKRRHPRRHQQRRRHRAPHRIQARGDGPSARHLRGPRRQPRRA